MTLSVASEGLGDGPLASVLAALVDPSPGRRPSADRAVPLLAAIAAGESAPVEAAGVVPRQLPSPTRDFVRRAAESSALTGFVDEAVVDDGPVLISTVAGGGGSGRRRSPCTGRIRWPTGVPTDSFI